jgi:hypothetical protein
MPSAWNWTNIAELLSYASTLIAGANAYCGIHYGAVARVILPLLDGIQVGLAARCLW